MGADEQTAISAAFGEAVAQARTNRGWSAQKLSDRLSQIGFPISRSTIAKIEAQSGRRSVTLDEAVAISIALEIPLPLMVASIRRPGQQRLTNTITKHPWRFYDWMIGRDPLGPFPTADLGGSRWREAHAVAWAYEDLVAAQKGAALAGRALVKAEAGADQDRIVKAREAMAGALLDLFDVVKQMRDWGLSTEGLVTTQYMDIAEKLGVEWPG